MSGRERVGEAAGLLVEQEVDRALAVEGDRALAVVVEIVSRERYEPAHVYARNHRFSPGTPVCSGGIRSP